MGQEPTLRMAPGVPLGLQGEGAFPEEGPQKGLARHGEGSPLCGCVALALPKRFPLCPQSSLAGFGSHREPVASAAPTNHTPTFWCLPLAK